MTDIELLQAAADAAGIPLTLYTFDKGAPWGSRDGFIVAGGDMNEWNPLEDDGEALRLAVKLGIAVLYADFTGEAEAKWMRGTCRLTEYGPADPMAATRRAIVRAAAEIAKGGHRD